VEILVIALSVLSISFFIAYLHAAINLKKTMAMFTELVLIHVSLQKEQGFVPGGMPNPEEIHKENFIKFLSDSRYWAYSYIEDVQSGLSEFINAIEPSINHFNKYGVVVDASPHYKAMKLISENFEKLKKLIPEDYDDRR